LADAPNDTFRTTPIEAIPAAVAKLLQEAADLIQRSSAVKARPAPELVAAVQAMYADGARAHDHAMNLADVGWSLMERADNMMRQFGQNGIPGHSGRAESRRKIMEFHANLEKDRKNRENHSRGPPPTK